MKIKIAYCIPALYWPSGMERVLTLKANYFADTLGYDVYIILTDGKEKPPYYKLSSRVHLINLDINFDDLYGKSLYIRVWGYIKKQYLFKKRLTQCLKKLKPDITISTLRREINFINSIKDGSLKLGEIHFSRANYRDLKQEKLPAFFQKLLGKLWMNQLIGKLKRLQCFIVLTHEDEALWPELKNKTVIPNPLSFYPEKSSNCNTKNVIAVGRYTYQKGFDLLLKAWINVRKSYPEWSLYIFGGGNRSDFLQLSKKLGISDVCFLESAVSNIEDKYQESSIFVLSSRYEGFGMVLIEAMACGVPPVSFACPCGPRDIIKDGEDGLLVENGNIKELADKICYLIDNEYERKRMGKQAKINIERFRVEHIARQWQNLFENLLIDKKID